MNVLFLFRRSLLPFLAAAFLFTPIVAQAQDAIGRIIQTAGAVTAVNATGAERQIARGSEIFIGEAITTGPRGSAQLRLIDGAVISLEVDTVFTVDDYEFDGAGGAADTTIMTMARGTMRTLTGVIGDDPADIYEMNTPFASIGVRGTEYAVVVEPNGNVRVFVFDGSVSVSPPAGGGAPTIVGIGGDSDGVEVDDTMTVTEVALTDLPDNVQAQITGMTTEEISEARVNALPSPETAIQLEINLQQRAREQQQQNINEANDTNDGAAGQNVDADGRVQLATTENELINARAVVVISVSKTDPNAFDQTTIIGVTPNN